MSDLKILIKILSLLVFLAPCVGRAANWKSMGSTPVAKFYHDADQLVGEQENRKLVVKVNYAEETKDGTRSALQEIFVNCIDRTYSIGIVKRYSLIDLQGGEKTIPATGRKQSPVQGSLGEDYIKRACESPPKTEQEAIKPRKDLEQQDALTQTSKLRELLRNTWRWDDTMIRDSINLEMQNIRKQNPNFSDDQVRNAVYDLWAKRAKEITNPDIVEIKVPNAVQLATVLPKDRDFVFPMTNISSCDKHCLSLNDYRKTCSIVKNLTYQAAIMSTVGGLDARLLERRGAISDVMFKWEKNQCVMQYNVTGIFSGKKEGCRVFGLVTAFAVGEPGGIVANRAFPIASHPNSTCRLY